MCARLTPTNTGRRERMSKLHCVEDHDPETICEHCNLPVDCYGNTEADFVNCCFPDCGCDGARLCMAPSGPNNSSMNLNLERGSTFYPGDLK